MGLKNRGPLYQWQKGMGLVVTRESVQSQTQAYKKHILVFQDNDNSALIYLAINNVFDNELSFPRLCLPIFLRELF